MAFQLLKTVAARALNKVGGAASSAFNYLKKNAPDVIDQTLESNIHTRPFSQRGRQEISSFAQKVDPILKDQTAPGVYLGRLLQKTPKIEPYSIETPQGRIEAPQADIGTNVYNFGADLVKGYGRTIEKVSSQGGRAKAKSQMYQLKNQIKSGKILDAIQNPATEDALNTLDLFTLGAGTLTSSFFRKGAKGVVEKGAQEVAEQSLKKVAKQEAERTIFKRATEKGTKTVDLFSGANKAPGDSELAMNALNRSRGYTPEVVKAPTKVPANEQLAMNALRNTRQGTGQTVTDIAQATGEVLESAKTKTADIFQKGSDIARKWINTREGYTQWRAGDIKKNPLLTEFDKEGIDAILDLQSGQNAARYQPIKDFTDGLFELEKKAGILEPGQYRQNYLPQLWDNTPEEIEQIFKGETVGGTPGFSKARILEDYKTGIDAGLTPRFNTMSDLLESRFKTAQKALADKDFVDNLVKTGNAKPFDKAPKGWQLVDLKHNGKPLMVDAQTAKLVRNYLSEGSQLLERTAQFVSEAKQTILSAGIPKSGWNFHTGVNVPIRAVAARKNPFGAIVDSVIWNTNPKSAVNYIEKVVPKEITDGLLKQGLTISRSSEAGGYGFKPEVGTSLIKKTRGVFDKLFSEAAFDKVLPAHKLKVGWESYQRAIKQGISQDEAFRIGAETANTVFGGVNTQELGRSKDFQNVMRTLLLAPDWLESNIKIAKKGVGLMDPRNWAKASYAPYKRFAANAASMYTAFAMTNKALSGHWPWENGEGQEFNLATGSYDERGRERVVPAFGTAFDFLRIPLQIVQGVTSGSTEDIFRPLKNRLSPPVGAVYNLVQGEDYRGRPIDTPAEVVTQFGQAVGVPSQITNVIGGLTGEQTPEEVAVGLLEAPIRYRGGARTAEQRKTAELLKEGGASNEELNQAFASAPPVSSKSLFSSKKDNNYNTLGASSDGKIVMPKTKKERDAFNESVDTALENGAELPDSAIVTRFFDGKTYDKSARTGQQEILNEMLKISEDEYLTPEQKDKIAKAAKIDPADLEYYKNASMDSDDRLEGLLTYAATASEGDRDEFMENLIMGKKQVGGKSMFSTTMYDRLYDEGLISKEEKKLITAIKYDPIFNKFYMDRDYKGGLGGSGGGSGGGGGLTPAKVKSYVNKINSIFNKTIKGTSSVDKQLQELSKPIQAPKIKFSDSSGRAPARGSTSRWFTQY